ncbi:hypothetical protein tloyanaT_26090 [Thalassotalea loyana]|uniref:Uncharacterized protein n=1 Tax=Thalassotalea loyana TaxID=280483 RepID=A0ABQ6HHI1_9GAMM|nr:hypothetical protein [Thalassotalea loyana]GLX86356.1 hypothetical protein tloyanaT_26090 [Thalassotalea loyana]
MSISAALALADLIGVDDWLLKKLKKSDSGAAKVASKVIEFASNVTGEPQSTDAMLEKLKQDNQLQMQLSATLVNNEHELKRLAFEDRKDARQMYQVHNQQADVIAERIMKWNLPYIFLLLIANALAAYFLKEHSALLLAVGNVIGMAIKSLFDERKEVTGFFFGSSMGSKQKDMKEQ